MRSLHVLLLGAAGSLSRVAAALLPAAERPPASVTVRDDAARGGLWQQWRARPELDPHRPGHGGAERGRIPGPVGKSACPRVAHARIDMRILRASPSRPACWRAVGRSVLLAAAVGLATGAVEAQRLVTDIARQPLKLESRPGATIAGDPSAVRLGTIWLLTAEDPWAGIELFATDGTRGGTRLLRDIVPGPASSQPMALTAAGGIVYFSASSSAHGREPWVSDGTAAGTRMLADVATGTADSDPWDFTELGDGRVVFTATTPATGRELWVTDGTAAGTRLVADLLPGPAGLLAAELVAYRGMVYVAANLPGTGKELYVTDGTAAGTRLVRDIHPGPNGSGVADLGVVGDTLFFSADDGTHGAELWRSDGTTAGTRMVTDLWAGRAGSGPVRARVARGWASFGTMLVMQAATPATGRELFVSDGTAAGTRLLADLLAGASGARPSRLAVIGTRVYCSAPAAGGRGHEPHAVDLVTGEVSLLGDVAAGAESSRPADFTPAAGGAVFTAFAPARGREMWFTDGTAAGTRLVTDLRPGTGSGAHWVLFADRGRIWFCGDDGVVGRELFVTDGTAAGTALVRDIGWIPGATAGSDARLLTRSGDTVFFAANDGVHGEELWATDGTAAGTRLVRDIAAGPRGSEPTGLAAFRDGVLFAADDGQHGRELWFSDGTAAGTVLVRDLEAGSAGSAPEEITVAGGRAIFVASTSASGAEPFVTDGTAAGTVLLRDISPGPAPSSPAQLTAVGDSVAFRAAGSAGSELWWTDGTVAGTRPAGKVFEPLSLTAWAGRVWFSARTGPEGHELWSSDGTDAGTGLVRDIMPGIDSSVPRSFAPFGDRLLFAAHGPQGLEVWSTDGTAAGTGLVLDIVPGPRSSDPRDLVAVGPQVFFFSTGTGIETRGLWRTDGTAAGTWFVSPMAFARNRPGPAAPNSIRIGTTSRVLYASFAFQIGCELWESDGTAAGTRLVADLAQRGLRLLGACPSDFVRLGTRILFVADDGVHGREPWSIDLAELEATLAAPYGRGCPGTGGRRPELDPVGQPALGNTRFALALAGGRPQSAAAVILGTRRAALDIGAGCSWLVGGHVLAAGGLVTDGSGGVRIGMPIADLSVLLGVEAYVQAAVADPRGAWQGLATFSNGVEIVVGR